MTGVVARLIPEAGGKTVILGWNERFEVFTAFEVNRHPEALGWSPSIQLRQRALESARVNGTAHHLKGRAGFAFAAKPSYTSVYLDNMEDLHVCGSSVEALRIFEMIYENPDGTIDGDIELQGPAPRRHALASAK